METELTPDPFREATKVIVLDTPIAHIHEWLRHDIERVYNVSQQPGGWEGWAQVELAMRLRSKNVDVKREQRNYQTNTSDAFDFWIQHNPGTKNVGIELRVRIKDKSNLKFQTRL
jgi:hypothetical protein